MPKAEIGQAVQLLDLMLEFFADDGHWTRGCYDDGDGGHCLVGAVLHLSRKHRLPAAPVIALLQVEALGPLRQAFADNLRWVAPRIMHRQELSHASIQKNQIFVAARTINQSPIQLHAMCTVG